MVVLHSEHVEGVFVLLINIETANTTFDGVPIMTASMPEFGLKRPSAKESFSR